MKLFQPLGARELLFDIRIILGIVAGIYAFTGLTKRTIRTFLLFVILYYITIMIEHVLKNDSEKKEGVRKELPLLAKFAMLLGFIRVWMM